MKTLDRDVLNQISSDYILAYRLMIISMPISLMNSLEVNTDAIKKTKQFILKNTKQQPNKMETIWSLQT